LKLHYNSRKNKYLLFTPGPVNVAKNVRSSMGKSDICHRESDFEDLLLSVENKLMKLFEIKNVNNYSAVFISGSGTAANEAILSSVVGNKNILVLSNGEFGERLHSISQIHNVNTYLLEFPWGKKFDLEVIDSFVKKNKIDIIAMVHHETSSGMLNSMGDIGSLSKSNGSILFVDCVSSAGAETIDMEKDNIAFCSSSSSKAIGSYAGLSFVIGETVEFEKLKNLPVKTSYLNLYKFYQFSKNKLQTPNTPAIPLFFALEQALANILLEGVANRHAKIRRKAKLLRQGMLKLGLNFLLDQKEMSSVLTNVFIPININFKNFRQKLREEMIIIYEGKGCFKDRIFQVGNIGELSNSDIRFFLSVQKEALSNYERHQPVQAISIIDQIPLLPLYKNDVAFV
jgi:2-aminoethylphosphonate-pyruvate transaminase